MEVFRLQSNLIFMQIFFLISVWSYSLSINDVAQCYGPIVSSETTFDIITMTRPIQAELKVMMLLITAVASCDFGWQEMLDTTPCTHRQLDPNQQSVSLEKQFSATSQLHTLLHDMINELKLLLLV